MKATQAISTHEAFVQRMIRSRMHRHPRPGPAAFRGYRPTSPPFPGLLRPTTRVSYGPAHANRTQGANYRLLWRCPWLATSRLPADAGDEKPRRSGEMRQELSFNLSND